MKLRYKFIVLIIGIIVLPVLVMGFLLFFQFNLNLAADGAETRFVSTRLLQRMIEERRLPRPLRRLKEKYPGQVPDTIFLDSDNRVIFSTTSDFFENQVVTPDEVYHLLNQSDDYKDLYFHDLSSFKPGWKAYQLFRVPLNFERRVPIPLTFIPSVAVLSFTALMSMIIILRINKSIRILQRGTQRIAQGDFDIPVHIGGRDEFASLSASFEMMRIKLKENRERQTRFFMGFSHDLKTPISIITGYIDAISEGYVKTPEQMTSYLSIIKDKSRLLENRISNLIEYVKMETGQWRTQLEDTELTQYIEETASRCRDEAEVNGFTFNYVNRMQRPVYVSMDRELIDRVFENLMQNALRYSGDEKTIGLALDNLDGDISLVFVNGGPGIQTENINRIFEPFFRESKGRNENGFGLGLASVKSIIEAHSWRISVRSVPDEETAFRIHIPKSLVRDKK